MNIVGTLEDLISINSVTGDEESILNFIEDFLIKNNFNGEVVRNDGGIIAVPVDSSKKVALVGHVDTVPVSDTQINTTDNDDLIVGRGTVDMKGGVAVILHALINEGKDIVGVFYTAEEGPYDKNGLGILMPILLSYSELEIAIIMEPTNNQIELGCLGALNATLQINGTAAHSARPWVGKNPIYDISKVTEVVLKNEILDLDIEGLNYKQVLSITKLSEGIAKSYGGKAIVEIDDGADITYNDPEIMDRMLPSLKKSAGNENVILSNAKTLAEDYAYYLNEIPGFLFELGGYNTNEEREAPAHHTPDFFIDDSSMLLGVKVMTNLALDFLKSE